MSVTYRRADDALWRVSAGHVVLLATGDEEQPFTVTGPGTSLWQLLARPRTIEEMSAALAVSYGVGVDEVRTGITPLLEDLVQRRVVTEVVES